MSLVALDGTPLVPVGGISEVGTHLGAATVLPIDATGEAHIYVGQIFTEDGGSHTLSTAGSSSIGFRTGGSTVFANAGTTVKVGVAAVDTANGPPARAVNVADVITFDVSATFTGGGGGIANNAWNVCVPTAGSKTIANGDLVAVAVQMTARAGADIINFANLQPQLGAAGTVRPNATTFVGAAYGNGVRLPNFVITFSDGTLGFMYGGAPYTSITSQSWNNTSGQKEFGNYFSLPVPTKVYGFAAGLAVGTGDVDVVLYSDPFGTPVAEKTVSYDANAIGVSASTRWNVSLFPSPYTTSVGQPLALIAKPNSANNATMIYISVEDAAHMKAYSLGTNCYAIARDTGAFSVRNNNKDRFPLVPLIGAFSDGGFPASRVRSGM